MSCSEIILSSLTSLIEILRATLKRIELQPEFSAADSHAREMRRWLLIAIADLEERINDDPEQSASQTFTLPEAFTLPEPEPLPATSWIRLKSNLPKAADSNVQSALPLAPPPSS